MIFSSTGQKIFSWIRLLSFSWSRLKRTDFELVAGNRRTGIETKPKVRLAVDIERAAIAGNLQEFGGPYYTDVLPRNSTIERPGAHPSTKISKTKQSSCHKLNR